jgi:hypothetical protein
LCDLIIKTRAFIFLLNLAALAQAQILDLSALDASPEPDSVPVGTGNDTSVVHDQVAAIQNAADSIDSTAGIAKVKRVSKRTACDPQPVGAAPGTSPDTPEDFFFQPRVSGHG